MVPERRRKRSSFSGLALHYWLAAVARRKHLWGLVLADSAGLLVAASMKGEEAEEVAALAPLLVQGRRPGADAPDAQRGLCSDVTRAGAYPADSPGTWVSEWNNLGASVPAIMASRFTLVTT